MIIPNIWENKIHVPNHQPDGVTYDDVPIQHGDSSERLLEGR